MKNDTEELQIEVHKSVVTLWLNRPQYDNAINAPMKNALVQALGEINCDESIACVVLRGRGGMLSSGQDRAETNGMDAEQAMEWVAGLKVLYSAIRDLSKPSVAVIEGVAAAVSLQMALLCDLRIAASSAKLSMPELKIGIPCITGTGLMIPMVGEAITRQLVFVGDEISAEQAKTYGLVTTVAMDEQLETILSQTCNQLSRLSSSSVKLSKEWLRELSEENYQKTFQKATAAHAAAFGSGEAYRVPPAQK